MSDQDQRPLAGEDLERDAAKLFPLEISPDEYAARNAHNWLCFSMDEYRYRDPERDAWIQRLGDIFFGRNGAPTVRELRLQFLTESERLAAEAREREEF